jgi:hypothetical protein
VAGYANASNAQKAAMQLLEDTAAETVEQYRAITSRRLERLLASVWSAALSGDGPAFDRAERTVMDLAKLHGAIMPTRVEITDEMDREIAALAQTLATEDGTFDITSLDRNTEEVGTDGPVHPG